MKKILFIGLMVSSLVFSSLLCYDNIWEYCADEDNENESEKPVVPIAHFSFDLTEPRVGDQVTFDASVVGSANHAIVSYQWDFGDGNSATTNISKVMYFWDFAGSFRVSLVVIDEINLTSETSTEIITVRHQDYDDKWSGSGSAVGGGGVSRSTNFPVNYHADKLIVTMHFVPDDTSIHLNVTVTMEDPDGQIIYDETKDSYLDENIVFSIALNGEYYQSIEGMYTLTMEITNEHTNAGSFEYTADISVTY